MTKRRFQFSMFTLLLTIAWGGVFLGLNLRTEAKKTWSGNAVTFLKGYREFPADQLSVRRGWPLRFLDHSQFVAHGRGDAIIEAGLPTSLVGVPRVSHLSRLVINAAVGLALTLALTYLTNRIARLSFKRLETRNTTTVISITNNA